MSVPKKLDDRDQLIELYGIFFDFVEGFGHNWDAFNDCICSYDNYDKHDIIIVHFDVPFQSNSRHRKIYLETLNDSIMFWRKPDLAEHHSVAIYFPESCRSEIAQVLDS